MPEYLAPGVYVEETSFRAKSIEGVSTSTAAFVGATRKGPLFDLSDPPRSGPFLRGVPEVITSELEFERVYGGLQNLSFNSDGDSEPSEVKVNYLAHAVKAFFNNGGSRLYVARTFVPRTHPDDDDTDDDGIVAFDGIAHSDVLVGPEGDDKRSDQAFFVARMPGSGLNLTIKAYQKSRSASKKSIESAPEGTLLSIGGDNPLQPAVLEGEKSPPFKLAHEESPSLSLTVNGGDEQTINFTGTQAELIGNALTLNEDGNLMISRDDLSLTVTFGTEEVRGEPQVITLSELPEEEDLQVRTNSLGLPTEISEGKAGEHIAYYCKKQKTTWMDSNGTELRTEELPIDNPKKFFVTLTLEIEDADGNQSVYEDMGFAREHPRWVGEVLKEKPPRRLDALLNPCFLKIGQNLLTSRSLPFDLREGLCRSHGENTIIVKEGNDGEEPTDSSYEDALSLLEAIENISILAAPGHSEYTDFTTIQDLLIGHASRMKYRIAVLDTPSKQTVSEARETRSRVDSSYAALYYPWIVIANPLARPGNERIPREIAVPPSGFVAGIYARTDIQRGVWKAPANEVVLGVQRFESEINFGQQEILNPEGINCLRFFFGRGYRVWGARTASSDPEWKYVNVRRYFIYLEQSIDRGTQWAVFEPNGERLWANIRSTISDFLYNEWVSGALLGSSPEEAFFVKCDRSTMTQNDLDNGRLICLIGVAALKPAEFVIFRIGQKTADARS